MSDDETFYEVLSVPPDASRERIRQAYREQVKEHHPDVSDAPGARDRFKRVTRAKTVLTDRRERKRYDRLGHETYLERERSGRTHRPDRDGSGSESSDSPPSGATTDATRQGAHAAGTDAQHDPNGAGSAASRAADEAEQTTHADAGSGDGTAAGAGTTSQTRSREGPPGRFAVREAVAATVICLAAGASVALALVPPPSMVAAGVLLASWVIVAAIAGRLAAGSAPTLPDDVVRAQAFPLLLLVVAWYVRLETDYRVLAGGVAAYGLFAAVFRTAALASSRRGSALRSASLWFVATAPAAVVGYVSLTGVPGVPSAVTATVSMATLDPVGGELVLAVAGAVVVTLGHALWRLGRALA